MIYLDTHVVLRLHDDPKRLVPAEVRDRLRDIELRVSPMVILELTYLYEIGRVGRRADDIMRALSARLPLAPCDLPFAEVIRRAATETWTRDPFDRVIVGQAAAKGAPLATADTLILEHYPAAFWSEG